MLLSELTSYSRGPGAQSPENVDQNAFLGRDSKFTFTLFIYFSEGSDKSNLCKIFVVSASSVVC